jgi:glutathione peroxidase
MTFRQTLLKLIYPLWMFYNKKSRRRARILHNENEVYPPYSFYDLAIQLNNGNELKFDSLRGKKVLLVNTASDCGYTNQYIDLEKLYEANKEKLVVIGFPANDFKQQEKGSDEEIAQFCRENYGVSFPLVKKSIVIKADGQNVIYKWLTDKTRNGWNNKQPSWNFSKYLVSEKGALMNYFDASISPLSEEIVKAVSASID